MERVLAQCSLEMRVALVERQGQQVRRFVIVSVMAALLFVALDIYVGRSIATTGERGQQPKVTVLPEGRFSSIETRSLKLMDDSGRERASLGISQEAHGGRQPVLLALTDETGEERLELEAGSASGSGLSISRAGTGSVRVAVKDSSPYVQLVDDKGKVGAVLWFMNDSPHLVLSDENGRTRAIFGYESGWPGRDRPPSTIALYDEQGKIIWSATQEEGAKNTKNK